MKLFRRPIFRIAVTLAASAFAVCTVWAQAPSRVARLSDFAGEIQLANEREGWHPISRNFPITVGDNLFVGQGGRAELDVGSVQAWIAGGSNVYFDQFDDQVLSVRLTEGAMMVRIRTLDGGDAMRVTTLYGEIAFTQPGFYAVSVATPGSYESQFAQPTLKVGRGEAQFFAPNRAPLGVRQGQVLTLDRNELRSSHFYSKQALDSFEAWAASRDGRMGRLDQRYAGVINPRMIGALDLSEYGTWAGSYEYGQVWYPTSVAADWAPYRFGRWSWVQPWGWTWVDDAVWGFAPFHYGRWVRVGTRWAWSPGQNVARPIYAPALVTFFGGEQWNVGGAGPVFSWVPLGWNEPYAPWYTYTPTYWREVNRPYVRSHHSGSEPWRPQYFAHASMPGAITAVASTAFLAGRPIAQHYLRNMNERDLRVAPPARMGEVLPQPSRFANPAQPPMSPRAGEPSRLPTAPILRERGRTDAPHLAPNTNVMQPRVIQDSDAGRPPQSGNTRINEPATPTPKPRDDRTMAPRYEPMQPAPAPQPGYRSTAPQAVQAPAFVASPQALPNAVNAPAAPMPPRRVMDNRNPPLPESVITPTKPRVIQPVQPALPAAAPPATVVPRSPLPDSQRVAPTPSSVAAPVRVPAPTDRRTLPAAPAPGAAPTPDQTAHQDKGRALIQPSTPKPQQQ